MSAETRDLEREAKTVDVACGIGKVLRRNLSWRADERSRIGFLNDKARVREDRASSDIDHVAGLDVTVLQVVTLKRTKTLRQRKRDPYALIQRQGLFPFNDAGERLRTIIA